MNYLKINQTNTCKFGEIDIFDYFYWPEEGDSIFIKTTLIEAIRLESWHGERVEFEDVTDVVEVKQINKISISL